MEMRYNYREYFDILTKVPVTFQRKIMGAYVNNTFGDLEEIMIVIVSDMKNSI